MNAEDFTVNVDEDQRRNNGQVSFIERTEEDIEEIVEKMQTVPSSRVEESVKGIGDTMNARDESENLDSLLRDTVTVHARAPIRSTINPDAHTVETESGRELQVAGEEYFLNQNSEALGDFMDISNVKWYKLEDNGVSTEETRNDREGEHLRNTATSEYGVEGFHIEVDGEPLDAQEVEAFRRSISRREQATVAPHNEVTSLMMDYDSLLDAVENEDISEQEFNQLYDEALSDGLVTEDGDFTLKGWLSAVDLRGPDLRSFEEVARGRDELETSRQGAFDSIADVREHDTTTRVNLNNISWSKAFLDLGVEDLQQDEAENILSTFGEDFEELREQGELRVNAEVEDIIQAVYGEELYGEKGLSLEGISDISTDSVESLHKREGGRYTSLEYTAADLLDYSLELLTEDERQREAFLDLFEQEHGSYEEMKKEIRENMAINDLSLDYEGNRAPEGLNSSLGRYNVSGFDDEGVLNRDWGLRNNPANLLLLPFQEELEEHDYDPTDNLSDLVREYGEASNGLRERIETMEEEGLLDTRINERDPAEVDLQPETEEHYRMIDEAFRETDIDIPFKERPLSRSDVEVDTVHVDTDIFENAEALDEELEQHEEEVLRLLDENNARQVFSAYGRESIMDYASDGLTKKVHETVDKSGALQKVRKALMGRADKEIVGREIGPHFSALEFTDPEDERVTDYFEDLDRPGSEELLKALEKLEDEGLLELEYGTDSTKFGNTGAETEIPDYEGSFEIQDYHELGEEEKQTLYELEEEGVLDLDEGRRDLEIAHSDELSFRQKWEAEATHIDTVFGEDEEESTYENRIEFEHDEITRYETNEQVREIAEALDPMNFDKKSYEDIKVETDFSYSLNAT